VPLFEAPATNTPAPVESDQSPWPVLVLTAIVPVIATVLCVLLSAVIVTGEAWQLTAVPASPIPK
jgi:hypothetical protein